MVRASKNGSKGTRHGQGNTEAAQNESLEGGVATMTRMSALETQPHTEVAQPATPTVPITSITPVDPVAEARKLLSDSAAARENIGQKLMDEYKATDIRLREISATMLEMGMNPPAPLDGITRPEPAHIDGRSKQARAMRAAGKIDGRSKEARALRAAGKIDGRSKEARALREDSKAVKPGSNSAHVLALVQKYAPGKTKGKTKKELRELAAKDPKFSSIDDTSLNAGLQANRPPKVRVPRIGLTPNADGNPRGGKYYAMV